MANEDGDGDGDDGRTKTWTTDSETGGWRPGWKPGLRSGRPGVDTGTGHRGWDTGNGTPGVCGTLQGLSIESRVMRAEARGLREVDVGD